VAAVERPFPPGDYDVVVVGSGPGGLQTSYCLRSLGVRHAVLSRDDRPAGMFRHFPIFQRLITWTKPDAPVEKTAREYEWYDHNSLLADEPELKAVMPGLMDRAFDLPSRHEMEAGLVTFAERAGLEVRYGCTWESTRQEDDGLVLVTSDGEYKARAVVFALGVTEPWLADVPGLEHASHYVETRDPARYQGREVFVVGKRNSGFEVAQGDRDLAVREEALNVVDPLGAHLHIDQAPERAALDPVGRQMVGVRLGRYDGQWKRHRDVWVLAEAGRTWSDGPWRRSLAPDSRRRQGAKGTRLRAVRAHPSRRTRVRRDTPAPETAPATPASRSSSTPMPTASRPSTTWPTPSPPPAAPG